MLRPKSVTKQLYFLSKRIFSNLISRCAIFLRCKYSIADVICLNIFLACFSFIPLIFTICTDISEPSDLHDNIGVTSVVGIRDIVT
ncbi:hypothetical protein DERF_001358 [Dermatophagoides farinae]|uniref:Uncharacterized protein n=1 Tax=Dermatophagoides farinae TaxID=6954 RepID=A0A922L8K7_DERFA|nr:hypothetical protein DERF_001358 [Dermatophagoides farinae]